MRCSKRNPTWNAFDPRFCARFAGAQRHMRTCLCICIFIAWPELRGNPHPIDWTLSVFVRIRILWFASTSSSYFKHLACSSLTGVYICDFIHMSHMSLDVALSDSDHHTIYRTQSIFICVTSHDPEEIIEIEPHVRQCAARRRFFRDQTRNLKRRIFEKSQYIFSHRARIVIGYLL